MTSCAEPRLLSYRDLLAKYDIGYLHTWELLGGGMFQKPIRIGTSTGMYVLRAHRFRNTKNTFQFQADTLHQVNCMGCRTPQVIRRRNGEFGEVIEHAFWALHEYIPGYIHSWDEWFERKSNPGFLEWLGGRVAKLHDALSRIAPGSDSSLAVSLPPIQFHFLPEIREHWDEALESALSANAVQSGAVLKACRTEIETYWDLLSQAAASLQIGEFDRQIVHGDISPVNIVFDSSEDFVFIDWDCVHLGIRLYDALGDVLNRPPWHMAASTAFNVDELRSYLRGYNACASSPFTKRELDCIPAFCIARQLEDLRQRVSVLAESPRVWDEEFATLIQGRVQMMRSICEQPKALSNVI